MHLLIDHIILTFSFTCIFDFALVFDFLPFVFRFFLQFFIENMKINVLKGLKDFFLLINPKLLCIK